ncbi:DNA adenine methylase [Haladaptatus sp. ZSTT2]|uniref:DNA adenine methylase n=1 Tax=Haladaptatus sp. ZSTT2 TaxID=3120515 RepID=UPI00300F0E5F
MVDPVLKWAGGKRRLLDEIYAHFPEEDSSSATTTYHEPFFGGGALFFDLEPTAATINDTNSRLMNFYRQIRDNPEKVLKRASKFRDPHKSPDPERPFAEEVEEKRDANWYYYQQRRLFNNPPDEEPFDEIEEAAILLYLNRTCFNGLYRENRDGEFNVPVGRYSEPNWERADLVREASRVLQESTVEIFDESFEYVLDEATAGDLVYFDPPYTPMSTTAEFTEYSKEGFGQRDQATLLSVARELHEMDAYVILSNSGVMAPHYEDEGFTVTIEGAKRYINSDGENRGEVDEILATNVPEIEAQLSPSLAR